MSDPRDYKLDLSSRQTGDSPRQPPDAPRAARPWLSAYFACCNVYRRLYRDPTASHYDGGCPRCGKRVRFVVGPGGTTARSFVID